ncbi:Serine/threonine-protein kinase Nek3 [Mactra antiquata]
MNSELDLQYDRLLGEGSYGKVFLVKQQDGQQFAVKEIDLAKCDEPGREQAHGEANLLSRLKQDNILLYVESVICDECLYIVTEYCEGGDLEDYIQIIAKKKLTIPEALVSDWILQLGRALKYLHEQKILHRDMKTKNIFLKDDLTVKLGDLGIAKVLDLNQSKANTFIGTPSYMSPELFSGRSYNHKTDIWGLGCCAYEMMTLKRAFQGKALWTLIREIKNGRVLELPDTYSLDIRTLVQEMMSQQPMNRPSAHDIVLNDLLLYHSGAAQEMVTELPCPNEHIEEKQKVKNVKNKTGSGSGSLRNVLLQMNKSQDEKYRNSIAQVCEKINTLRMTGKSVHGNDDDDDDDGGGEYDTFVYKGDSDEELEAQGTILDSSLIRQYTEQLDTFVFKGEGILDNDSTVKQVSKNSKSKNRSEKSDGEDDDDDDDNEYSNRTLLKQYSETLEDDDDGDGVDVNDDDDDDNRDVIKGDNHVVSHEDETDSHMTEDNFDETIVNFSKYQYKGLKDTLALRRDKKAKKQPGDSRDLFKPTVVHKNSSSKSVKRSESDSGVKSPPKFDKLSLSASFSSASSLSGTKQRVSDPRLNQSMRSEDGLQRTKGKMRTCDRIEQSAKIKESLDRKPRKRNPPKTAFIEMVPSNDDDDGNDVPELNVDDVITHLKDNTTPYSSVDASSELISPADGKGDYSKDESSSKHKKKNNFLKKQSEAKRKLPDAPKQSTDLKPDKKEEDVKLFTHAQKAQFTKSDSDDADLINDRNGKLSIPQIIRYIQRGCSEIEMNEYILNIQHDLVAGIGYDNFKKIVDILNMVTDEQEVKVHVQHLLGPKLYDQYKQHITVYLLLENGSLATTNDS